MRVPRPPSEPGKGSYWKLDPNHQPNADGSHNVTGGLVGATAGSGGSASRTSKGTRRPSSAKGSSGRRSTSDPNVHPLSPPGSSTGIPEIPSPIGNLNKRGNEPDPYLFKSMGTHAAPTIMTGPTATSSANRRYSHLLSHEYTSQQSQQMLQPQHQDHQSGQYATHMPSSFGLSNLNAQQQHHGFFPSTAGQGSGGDFGSSAPFYSNGAPGMNDTSMMDSSSDSSSFSRFSNQGIYFPPGAGGASAGVQSLSRPVSGGFPSTYGGTASGVGGGSGGSNNSHGGAYGTNSSHSYSGGMSQQSGSAGAPFHANSTGYGFQPFSRNSGGGGGSNGGNSSSGNNGVSSNNSSSSPSSYRTSVDYGSGSSSGGYNNATGAGARSAPSSMMGISSAMGSSFVGSGATSTPPTSNSFQGFVSSNTPGVIGGGPMSPPGGNGPTSSVQANSNSSGGSSGTARPPSSSITIPQDSRNSNSGGGGGSSGGGGGSGGGNSGGGNDSGAW